MTRRMQANNEYSSFNSHGREHNEAAGCSAGTPCQPVAPTVSVDVPDTGPVLVIDGEVVRPDEMKISGALISGQSRYTFWVTSKPTFFETGKTYRSNLGTVFECVRVDTNDSDENSKVAYGKSTFSGSGNSTWVSRTMWDGYDWQEVR
ncbi:hypothetical protein [Streptomyces sp. NPDC002057]|uniref:hypothetical protein n=1 Tax=Streptomyces sp. NPDC002057 TaxID=3154664 RepID=UPI003320DB08